MTHRKIGINALGNFAMQRWEKLESGKYGFGSFQLDKIAESNYFFIKGEYALKAHYVGKGDEKYLAVVLYKDGEPLLVGYNDMFVALGLSRAFQGSLWKARGPVGSSAEAYYIKYDVDDSVLNLLRSQGKTETLYKYLSTALVPGLLKMNPAAIGAEVTVPKVEEPKPGAPKPKAEDDIVERETNWGRAFVIQIIGGRPRFDALGILDERTLVVVEVKNMGAIEDFSSLRNDIVEMRERVVALKAFLDKYGAGALAALVSAFNGGSLGEGGQVRSAFAATPYFQLVDKVERVKFVLVLADVDRAVLLIYDADLAKLMDSGYLERVAREAYDAYKNAPWGDLQSAADFYKPISAVVDEVVDRYSEYAPAVRALR